VLGTRIPGPGAVYISQTLNFRAPVKIGDTVVVTVTVAELIGEIARATVVPLRGRRRSGAGWRGAGEGSKRARGCVRGATDMTWDDLMAANPVKRPDPYARI
jgi:hypothetical protein